MIVDFSQIETTENKDGTIVMEKPRKCKDDNDCRQDLGEICIWSLHLMAKTCYLPARNAKAIQGGKWIIFLTTSY